MKMKRLTRIPDTGCRVVIQASFLLLVVVLSACTTSRIDVARHIATDLEQDSGIVILARKKDGGQKTEESFMECLTEKLASRELPVHIYPEQEFVDKLFPWFESRTAPTLLEQIPMLLKRPGVSETIAEMGPLSLCGHLASEVA